MLSLLVTIRTHAEGHASGKRGVGSVTLTEPVLKWYATYSLKKGTVSIVVESAYFGQDIFYSTETAMENTTLELSTDGSTFKSFGSFNKGLYTSEGSLTSEAASVSGDVKRTTTITLNLDAATIGVKKFRIKGEWDNFINDVYFAKAEFTHDMDFTIPQMSLFDKPSYEFLNSGLTRVSYTKEPLNTTDEVSTMLLHINGTTSHYTVGPVKDAGYFDIPNSDLEYTYHFIESAFSDRVNLSSANISIPAFTFPTSANASYNTTAHTGSFSWNILPVKDGISDVIRDKFKVQIADNADFTNPEEFTTDYISTKETYKIPITHLGPHLWCRVARDHANFDWALSTQSELSVNIYPLEKNRASLSLVDGSKAIITWGFLAEAWIPGGSFIITRINNSKHSTTEIKLTEADFKMGTYTDEALELCNEYTYSLQVVPAANSAFVAVAGIQFNTTILPQKLGSIADMTATKGYFPDRTELTWTSNGLFDNYIIKRAVYGSTTYVELPSVAGTSATDYQADDTKGNPGVYYTYKIVGQLSCNKTSVFSNVLSTIGFRSPTGNINGKVSYESGQAVKDVGVRLQGDGSTTIGRSIYLNGNSQSFLKLDTLHTPLADSAFTVQAWIKPADASPASQVIFSKPGQYELGFNSGGRIYFSTNTQQVTAPYLNPLHSFIHISGIHKKDSLLLMVNDSVVARVNYAYSGSTGSDRSLYLGSSGSGNNFKGFITEVSLWNTGLNEKTIARNYTRMLAANEKGLAAYWRFNETITDHFYDLSHTNDDYNQNDGVMDPSAVTRADSIPKPNQLSLKGYSDLTGYYSITGIPYSGNGTTYAVVPVLGTHQFSPASVNKLLSATSTDFTVDFTDKSSFPVSGHIYYSNSTIPVKGVRFRIDGQYAQQKDATIVQTDAEGSFTISVPVGVHEVKAVDNNHIFENMGKITDLAGNNRNYQQPVSQLVLRDSTTIRFIGRVAGGAIQEALPLGHSLSTNNLGREMSISLGLTSGSKYELYSGTASNPAKTVYVNHLLASDQKDSTKIHRSKILYEKNSITIYPDAVTGEFEVDLIPENFIAQNVKVTGYGNLLENTPVALDFTSKFTVSNSVHAYTDTSKLVKGTSSYKHYSDTVKYNSSYKFIKRVSPQISLSEIDNKGKEVSYFGDPDFKTASLTGEKYSIPLIDLLKKDKAIYKFGYPVFVQSQTYNFIIKAFEVYNFYENEGNESGVIRQVKGKDVVDIVPTQDGKVSINNNLRSGPVYADTMSLNAGGMATYSFTAGDPDISSNGLKDFAASVKFGPATNLNWTWYQDPQMHAFVAGAKLSGTNFVTAGPDKLLMVLRDPPGSTSFSYASKGSTISTTTSYSSALDLSGNVSVTAKLGLDLSTFVGVGIGVTVGVIANASASVNLGVDAHTEYHNVNSHAVAQSTTLLSTFQTSADPAFVGANADVYVGNSTNITYGQSNNITMIRRSDLKVSDSTLYASDPFSEYLVVLRTGINLGETFGTLFAFPQVHIVNVLIPNLITVRNSLLLPSVTTDQAAQDKANTSMQQVYVSKLAPTDARFGKSNRDSIAFGASAKDADYHNGKSYHIFFPISSLNRTDTISTLNQWVDKWKQRIADNEKAKLESTPSQNYSFHAGSPISYSKTTSNSREEDDKWTLIISLGIHGGADVNVAGSGISMSYSLHAGTTVTGGSSTTKQTSQTLGFTLSSAGKDDYFSVDVNTAKDSSYVFRTKGGVSGCPYEGASTTSFYQPGTVIDQPTQRIEVPGVTVDQPVVNDVATMRSASYTLFLKNASEAKIDGNFILTYADNDSIRGATISIDGTPIGGGGRLVTVPYGKVLEKVLTIAKGPKAMNYDNIKIMLRSACQNSIADTVLVSAHFIPSCSDIHVKAPADNWVVNSQSAVNPDGNRFLPITLDQFDLNNSLFDHIELQYKPASESSWITAVKFYKDSKKQSVAEGKTRLILNAKAIEYNLVMDDVSFNDQNYTIRAVSFCSLGGNEYVTTESNLVNGIKDTYNPRLFGNPQPANGLLGINDDIRLKFNKDIAAGLLTNTDFQVTGIRNGMAGDHSVSVNLDGIGNYLQTEFNKNFTGKSITTEVWVLPVKSANQTLISQGNANESMEIALTADNYLQLTVGKKIIKSVKPIIYKPGEWAHVAMVYNAADTTVSGFYNFSEIISHEHVPIYAGIGALQFGRSVSKAGNYFAGKMHRIGVWSTALPATTIQLNSLIQLSGAENNLLAYYPMDEGKGIVCLDKAHGSNAALLGLWSTPEGKAISLNGKGYMKMNTGSAPITSTMDYSLELWFKAAQNQTDAALASNGKGDNSEGPGPQNNFFLGFENKLLTFQSNGLKVQAEGNYLDNNWHHVAVAVNRTTGVAQLYADGILKNTFDAGSLGGIAAASTYLGVRAWNNSDSIAVTNFDRYFKGNIDEFRIWNTYLDKTLINRSNNVRLKGNEIGLLAYYPFESYTTFQNSKFLVFNLSDQKIQDDPKTSVLVAKLTNALESNEKAPIKDRGPVEDLKFDFVANSDGIIINLQEPKPAVDKTIVTFQVKNIKDKNGNAIISPITWTAYIDQNPLRWSDNSLNLTKPNDSTMHFESYIVNSGGSIQNFSLSNLPGWLTADILSGTVAPNGKQKITFTVNQALNIGSYDEVLFMRNDNAETQSLALSMVVKGKLPDWSVNPSKFKYSMTIYGQLRVENLFSVDKDDLVGAFVNGKCVGLVNNTYNTQSDLWFTFMSVYSDSTNSNTPITFRIWQASTGRTFLATTSLGQIKFANNAILGTIRNPVIFDGATLVYEDIPLNRGWNWISFNVYNQASSSDINGSLSNGKWAGGDIIKSEELGFHQYSTTNGWMGTLSMLNNTSLFMLKADTLQTLSMLGVAVDVTKTPIGVRNNRWNYISYLPQINLLLSDALAGYDAKNEDVIKSQNGFSMYDKKLGWVGSLTFMEPGKGYMLYRKQSNDTTFRYPAAKSFFKMERATDKSVGNINLSQMPVLANSRYVQNMTVTARVGTGVALRQGDVVLAYSMGEVRAKARLITNDELISPTLFFNISSDEEQQPVRFQVERDGKVIAETTDIISFSSNEQLGTLTRPLVLDFNKQSGTSITTFPNPFIKKVTVSMELTGIVNKVHTVQISVFNTSGQLIISLPELKVNNGPFETSWNGKNGSGMSAIPGIYLMSIKIDGIKHFQKVIKN